MFDKSFKAKFTKYLTEGIPVHISEDEVFLFYEALDSFINEASNSFESYYLKGDDSLTICDKYAEYLNVSYEASKIVFRLPTSGTPIPLMTNDDHQLLGEAFLGVLLFVENLAPSGDLKVISEDYLDKWN